MLGSLLVALASLSPRHGGHHVQRSLEWLSRPDDPPLANASYYHRALLDHFDAVGERHWSQRYYVDECVDCGSERERPMRLACCVIS